MTPIDIDTLLQNLEASSHRYVSRGGYSGYEEYAINPDGAAAAALIRDLLEDRQRLIDERDEHRVKARYRLGEAALLRNSLNEALLALDAAHLAMDGTEEQLAEAGLTREQAIERANELLQSQSPFLSAILHEG